MLIWPQKTDPPGSSIASKFDPRVVTIPARSYSVPASFTNRPVSLRVYARRLVIAAEGQIIAQHERVIVRSHCTGRTIYDGRHYLSVLQRKPGALGHGASFSSYRNRSSSYRAFCSSTNGGDREMAEILTLVQDHDEQAVLSAVELALNRVHRASKICITAPKRAGNARRAVLRMLWSLKPCEGTDSPQTLVKRLDRNGEPAGSGFFRSLNDLCVRLGRDKYSRCSRGELCAFAATVLELQEGW